MVWNRCLDGCRHEVEQVGDSTRAVSIASQPDVDLFAKTTTPIPLAFV